MASLVLISLALISGCLVWIAPTHATPLGPDQDQVVSDTSDVLQYPGAGVWLPMAPNVQDKGVPQDATIIPTELGDGEVVAVLEPRGLQDQINPLAYAYPNTTASAESSEEGHKVHQVETQDQDDSNAAREEVDDNEDEAREQGHGSHLQPVHAEDTNKEAEVGVSAWLPATTAAPAAADDDAIQRANAISSPWADAMTVGLPPSVAYDWHFLLRLASKVRTAPFKPPQDDRARLKHLLAKIHDAQIANKLQASMLPSPHKHQHQLKTQLDAGQLPEDSLTWAWRRATQ